MRIRTHQRFEERDAGEKKCGKELKRFTLNAGDVVQVVQKVSGDA